jgi:hypothetical protein
MADGADAGGIGDAGLPEGFGGFPQLPPGFFDPPAPAAPAEPTEFELAVQGFGEQAGIAGRQLLESGLGTGIDPRFEAFRQSQLGLLQTQQQQQRARQSEFFTRRGIAGSSAQLNQQQQLAQQFGQQQQQISSQLGLQGLAQQRQDVEQGLEALAAQIETLSIPEQLRIAELAAEKAGTTVSSPRQKFLGIF